MQAYADGKKVEYFWKDEWWITEAPSFTAAYQWRVKPESLHCRVYEMWWGAERRYCTVHLARGAFDEVEKYPNFKRWCTPLMEYEKE